MVDRASLKHFLLCEHDMACAKCLVYLSAITSFNNTHSVHTYLLCIFHSMHKNAHHCLGHSTSLKYPQKLVMNRNQFYSTRNAVSDPGFPRGGGGGVDPLGGHGPPTWALFGKNVCKNERIGSRRGACA